MRRIHETNLTLPLIVFISALLCRLVFAFFLLDSRYPVHDDLKRYADWGEISYQHGIADTYTNKHLTFGVNPNNQPPGTLYIDYMMYSVDKILFHSKGQESNTLYLFLLKIPSIIADVGIGLCIFLLVLLLRQSRKRALMAASLFLFNPISIYNSAVWGQTDALNNFFFILSLLFFFKKQNLFCLLSFFTGLLIKISLLPLLPFVLLILIKQQGYKKTLMNLFFSILIILLVTLPVSSAPHIWWYEFLTKNSSGELQHITNYAYNFWILFFNPDYLANVPLSSQVYLGLPLSIWAYSIFFLLYTPLLLWVYIKKLSPLELIGIFVLVTLAIFVFLPRMHQRYMYPVFPLFAAYIGLTRKKYLYFIALSIINMINLYQVWTPFHFLPNVLENILIHSKVRLLLSASTVAVFILMYFEELWQKDVFQLVKRR